MAAKKLPPKPLYNAAALARGIRVEGKEHPEVPRKYIPLIVKDHLRKNPKEYR